MAEPQASTGTRASGETRSGNGGTTERARPDGQRERERERASWAEPAAQVREQQRQLGQAAGETAGVIFQDWTSTMMTLYARNLSMASRRAQALADYLDELAHIRQPADLMNVSASYWSRMIGDYSNFTVGEGGVIKDLMTGSRSER